MKQWHPQKFLKQATNLLFKLFKLGGGEANACLNLLGNHLFWSLLVQGKSDLAELIFNYCNCKDNRCNLYINVTTLKSMCKMLIILSIIFFNFRTNYIF